jgi:trans-AT polyketide synthase, acyltransferase and oxidoreductase domains
LPLSAGTGSLQESLLRLGEPFRLGDAAVPPCRADGLGDPAFRAAYGLKYAYVGGSMANGIASLKLAEALSREGMLGFFGSAGLSPSEVEAAVGDAQGFLCGFNLIHSPGEPWL